MEKILRWSARAVKERFGTERYLIYFLDETISLALSLRRNQQASPAVQFCRMAQHHRQSAEIAKNRMRDFSAISSTAKLLRK